MRIKLLPFLLSICFVYSQSQVDSAGSNIQNLKTEFDKLSNNVSTLDSLLKTKPSQSLTDNKFKQIDKSLSDINEELNSQINSINSSLEQIKDELINNINSLSDSLLTTANSILIMKEQNSFKRAFDLARINLGPNQKFEFNGKTYTTDYKDEATASPTIAAIRKIDKKIDELNALIDRAESKIATLDMLGKASNSEIQSLGKTITDRTLYWIIAILIVLIIIISIFFFLKSQVVKQQGTLSSVKEAQDKLEKASIKLDEKTLELFENQLSVMKLQPQSSKAVDHSFTLAVANEIQRIRNRLKHMPQDEQATKVIRKRVESLEDAIKENGYELIQLEGKPYKEGMTIKAQFVPDETLKKGDRIISRVIKPQINFDGKLIQVAEVQVRQGV